LLNIKCPQLSKPKAKTTVARNQNPSGTEWRKRPWEKPGSVRGPCSPLADEGTLCDSGSLISQIGSEHLEYLSISIRLEVEVITPVWR